MAIDYQRQETISRSSGRSAVAAMAYITRSQMHDERTNETHNYSKGHTAVDNNGSGVIGWNGDAASLANAMEAADKRKNSRTARTFIGALPNDLTHEQQNELARQIAQNLYEIDRAPLAYVVHRDKANNPHFHIIKATRTSEDGQSLGAKCRVWEDKTTGPKTCKQARQIFIDATNSALTIAHQTPLPMRDKEHIPQIHLGPARAAMERTKPGSTKIGRFNQELKNETEHLEQLKRKIERIRQKKRELIATITAKKIEQTEPPKYYENIQTVQQAYKNNDPQTAARELLLVAPAMPYLPQRTKRAKELEKAINYTENLNREEWPQIIEWVVNHPKTKQVTQTLKQRLTPLFQRLTNTLKPIPVRPNPQAVPPDQKNHRRTHDYPSR